MMEADTVTPNIYNFYYQKIIHYYMTVGRKYYITI